MSWIIASARDEVSLHSCAL